MIKEKRQYQQIGPRSKGLAFGMHQEMKDKYKKQRVIGKYMEVETQLLYIEEALPPVQKKDVDPERRNPAGLDVFYINLVPCPLATTLGAHPCHWVGSTWDGDVEGWQKARVENRAKSAGTTHSSGLLCLFWRTV
jgi:hypothetical protein